MVDDVLVSKNNTQSGQIGKKANSSNHCSFCGRSENEVTLLISGVSGFICDMCAEQAHEIVNETFKALRIAP